jgi:outer membrane protein TolC
MRIFASATRKIILLVSSLAALSVPAFSQTVPPPPPAMQQAGQPAPPPEILTLEQCIDYGLKHQPSINISLINVEIARTTNAINLAGWLPQANVSANLTHYLTLPTSFVNGNGQPQQTARYNSFTPILSVTQTIFNPSLLYYSRSAKLYVQQAEQITDSSRINIVATVSKSFYSLLLTLEQINVLKEDTARLGKNLHDTYHQYIGGIVDETDYDEAGISLNNSKAQLKQATENIIPQYALLKQVMGYPPDRNFNVSYDTTRMMNDIAFDTTQQLVYEKRIEFQELQISKRLQDQSIRYYESAWLPTLGAFFDYGYPFQDNSFGKLFSQAYPYSYIGLSLSWPIFTGFARTNSLKRARLQSRQLDWEQNALISAVFSEYTSTLANYKSNLYNLYIMRDNVNLARKVYDIVSLQYQQGTVAYLNVITAESNLINSEIGYQNALFTLMSSKIDLQKAMGVITINH